MGAALAVLMNPSPVPSIAQALLEAHRTGIPADDIQLVLDDAGDAYAVQERVYEALAGQPVPACRAWKSGGPSRAAALTHSPLPPGGIVQSGDLVPGASPLIEAEIALRLARDVDPQEAAQISIDEAMRCIDAMCVTIELVGFRWRRGADAPALHKLADFQSHAGLVVGAFERFAPRDWAAQACRVRIDGSEQEFRGTHSLGDPAWLLPQWMRHASSRTGVLVRGTLVTTGTWCGLLHARSGSLVEVHFAGVGAAVVQL